jgi:hypothetical protein
MKDLSNRCKICFLEEEIYVEQPMSYVIKGDEEKVLKLKKTILA